MSWFDRDTRYTAYLKTKEWRAKRVAVIIRCKNRCERCGKFAVAEVHHLNYDRLYHEELSDLQGLCAPCHEFVHGKSNDDGNLLHQEIIKEQAETKKLVRRARREIARFQNSPQVYLSFFQDPDFSRAEVMFLLRKHPSIIVGASQGIIVDVRYAKRKYESAIAFKVKTPHGFGEYCLWPTENADKELIRGALVFDIQRAKWVSVSSLHDFIWHDIRSRQITDAERSRLYEEYKQLQEQGYRRSAT